MGRSDGTHSLPQNTSSGVMVTILSDRLTGWIIVLVITGLITSFSPSAFGDECVEYRKAIDHLHTVVPHDLRAFTRASLDGQLASMALNKARFTTTDAIAVFGPLFDATMESHRAAVDMYGFIRIEDSEIWRAAAKMVQTAQVSAHEATYLMLCVLGEVRIPDTPNE